MENPIKIHVPVTVSYPALEGVLKQQMVGEYIPRPEKGVDTAPYAQILDIELAGSRTGEYNLMLRAKIRILRTVLKRDLVDLLVMAALDYDNATQQLYVRQFRLVSRTSSGFYNTALELLANKAAYHQILQKARFNLREVISKELQKANGLLGKGLELKGIKLTGEVYEVSVQSIAPLPEHVSLTIELRANLAVNLYDVLNLLPAKQDGTF